MINKHLHIWDSVWADEPKELPPSPTVALPLLSIPEVSIMACGGKKKGSKKKGK